MAIANAILVYEEEGQVKHRCCPEAEARTYLDGCVGDMRGGSMFAADGVDADFVLKVSPQLRGQVDDAKAKLKADIRLREVLDKHGVPREIELRNAVAKAFADLNYAA